ncbi:MAG: hypothetical protein ABR878_05855 [Roseiarcus sp.]|jgi:hypothetical protein
MGLQIHRRGFRVAVGSLAATGGVALVMAVLSQSDALPLSGQSLAQTSATHDPRNLDIKKTKKTGAPANAQSAGAGAPPAKPAQAPAAQGQAAAPSDDQFQMAE